MMKNLKLNFLFQIIISFLLTASLALLVANSMMTGEVIYTSEAVQSVYIPSQTQPEVNSLGLRPFYQTAEIDIFQFLVSFFVATSLMLLFLKKFKGKFLFEFFFSGLIIFGAQGPCGLFLSKGYAFLAAVLLLSFRFLYPRIWTQNLVIIIGISGVAASLGASMNPVLAILILIFLSIYDIIAVYKTRHMVKLFKGMAEKGVILALIIPKSFSLWRNKFSFIKEKKKDEFIFLGTGDIVLPLLFAVAVFADGFKFSLAIIFGSILGIIVDHFIFVTQKEKKAIPALPMIAFFAILCYVVALLI